MCFVLSIVFVNKIRLFSVSPTFTDLLNIDKPVMIVSASIGLFLISSGLKMLNPFIPPKINCPFFNFSLANS